MNTPNVDELLEETGFFMACEGDGYSLNLHEKVTVPFPITRGWFMIAPLISLRHHLGVTGLELSKHTGEHYQNLNGRERGRVHVTEKYASRYRVALEHAIDVLMESSAF